MRRVIAVWLLCASAAAVVLAAGPKIQAQYDKTFDFARLKTWGWSPSGAGDVKVWVSEQSKSEPVKRTFEPVIMQAVEDELAKRGLPRAASGTPDFTMAYYVLITLGSSSQHMGQFLPAVANWGLPPFTAQTTAFRTYPMGTLVLDVGFPDKDHVIWRAVALAEVSMDKTDDQRAVRLRGIIRDIVAKLPKTKK